MGEKVALRSVSVGEAGALAPFLNEMRTLVLASAKTIAEQNNTIRTLEQLLKGTSPPSNPGRGFRLPPVMNYTVSKTENLISFLLGPFKIPTVFPPIIDFVQSIPNRRTQLWRALADENALSAEFLRETTGNALSDTPPPGVQYRYWLRYVSDIDEQAGPFSPLEGIEFTAQEVANPEDQFNPDSGGIFLETFEGLDTLDTWQQTDQPNAPALSFPQQGVVGGVVFQVSGDQIWLVHKELIPFDPTALYRIRVGVRYTVAPSVPTENRFYCGITCVGADGDTLINTAGVNSYGSQHYIAANGVSLTPGGINNWQEFIGYFKGLGTPSIPAPNIYAPSPLFAGTKYFMPTFILNYADGDGTQQIDYIRIEALDPLDIALIGTLNPSSISLAANQLGQVLSYAAATGTFEVRYGTYLLNSTGSVTFSIQSNPNSLTASINASTGVFSITGGFPLGLDTATITFRAAYSGINVDRTLVLTKAVEGGFGWTPIIDIDSGGGDILIDGNSLQKIGGVSAWDSGVYSLEAYSGGARVDFRAAQTNLGFMVGLNSDPVLDANYTSIDYAWYLFSGGGTQIYENGSLIGTFGTYTTATRFAIDYDGEVVRYLMDDVVIRSVPAPGRTLSFDSSFNSPNAKAVDVQFNSKGPITAANRFVARGNNRYAGGTIEKVGGSNAWDSDCYSQDGYTEGAFCSASAAQTNMDIMFGLNSDPLTDQNYVSIDYAWQFVNGGSLWYYENGTGVNSGLTYTTSTVCAIRHVGSLVQWIRDGVVVRSVARVATTPLFFDSSLFHAGAKLLNVQYGPAGKGAEADPSAVYLQTFEEPWEITFRNEANASNVVVTYPNNGQFGGKVISAQRQLWIESNENIPYDANATYRITARIRRTAAGAGTNENVSVGVVGIGADGTTLINEAGAASHATQHFNCARNFDMTAVAVNTWRDFVGYFKGNGTTGFGVAANIENATPLYTGVRFFRPLLILNATNGTGTQECDFIKVERLITPDDADNTDKLRIVPDTEFTRATDQTHWWIWSDPGSGGGSTPAPTINLTGGNYGGYARIPTWTPGSAFQYLVSRRRVAYQGARGQLYTITVRARNSGLGGSNVGLLATVIRHAQPYTDASFVNTPLGNPNLTTYPVMCLGGISEVPSGGISANWTEYKGIVMLPGFNDSGVVDGQLPFISAVVGPVLGASGTAVDVDMVMVEPGANILPPNLVVTASTTLGGEAYFRNVQFNHATVAGTLTLPDATADNVGAKIYFEQTNAALLSIAPGGGDTLRAAPGLTGTRTATGRSAKMWAEVTANNEWTLYGQYS